MYLSQLVGLYCFTISAVSVDDRAERYPLFIPQRKTRVRPATVETAIVCIANPSLNRDSEIYDPVVVIQDTINLPLYSSRHTGLLVTFLVLCIAFLRYKLF